MDEFPVGTYLRPLEAYHTELNDAARIGRKAGCFDVDGNKSDIQGRWFDFSINGAGNTSKET